MWDLCDGEALEVEKIRRILSVPPSVRERDDTDELIDMLEDSDFLSQFPRDLQIQMSKGMKLLDYNEDELICQQNSTGDTLFLVVSGSVALHRTDASTGAGETDKQDARSNQSSHTWAGPCRRVLGVGDSFGELAFMQGRAHPTSAIARAQSTLIAMRQVEMEAHAVARMLSFVANPRSEAMEEVFAKDVHDRNEKDIMLLINYLEMNPFLKELLYPVMVDCAHSILRHEVPVGQQLHTDDISPGLSETRMYIVNGGSMEITPRVKNSPILIQLREITSQPATFGEKLQGNRRRGRARNQKVLFSGQLFVAAVERPKISEEGSRPTTSPRSLLTPNTNNPKRRVFGIDLSGLITYTSTIRDSGLTEVGYVSEICSLERTEIPDFTYALNMYIRGEQWVIASHVRSEYDAFINVLCDFNPYFNSIMKSDDNVFAQELVQLFRGELGWKNILLRIENNGQVSYSSNLSPDAKTEWLVIGTMQNCLDCEESPTREKPSAMKLNMASSFDNEHNVEWLFSTGSEAETQAWLNRFCLKCSQDVLNARFEKQNYGESALRSTLAIHSMLSRVLEHKRLRKLETKQRLARASLGNAKNKKKSCRDPKFDAISMDASVFVGYGSAFCTDGKGIANDEGCTLFSLSYGEWDRIRRRQIELESENVIQMVRNLPMLALASHRDLYNLTMNSFVNNFIMGEKVACSNLSSMHIHVVLTGTCKLRRVGRKEKHTDKMRYRLQSSLNSSSAIGDVRMCASCRGGGLEGTIPALTDRIKLCKDCNGLGQLVERPQDAMDVTDVSELRKGAILTRSIPCMDSLADYELMPTSSPFQLLVLRSDLWSTLKERLEKFGTAEPEPKVEITAADLTAKLLDNARKVRETVKKGPVKIHNPHQRFVKRLSIEEKVVMFPCNFILYIRMIECQLTDDTHARALQAHRLAEKAHSACTRQIDKLLMISRPPLSNVYVDSKRDVSSPTCKLPPPRTIKNKFTGPVPALNFERIFGDELRSVFLTNSPSKERGSRGSWKDSLLSPVKKLSITLKPLSEQHITGDLPEVLATSRSRPGDLGVCARVYAFE
jgi:CRP-like cAMP-binding protein